jgi:hypothetical protein
MVPQLQVKPPLIWDSSSINLQQNRRLQPSGGVVASTLSQILIQVGQIKPRRRFFNNCIFKAVAPAAASRSTTLQTQQFEPKGFK